MLRPVVMAVGAFFLVLGGALISVGPFIVSTGYISQELRNFQTSPAGSNSTNMAAAYANIANQGELIVLVGAIVAPAGGAILAYGYSTNKPEEVDIEPTHSSA